MLSKCVACWVFFLTFGFLRKAETATYHTDPPERPVMHLTLSLWKILSKQGQRNKKPSEVSSKQRGCANICTIIMPEKRERVPWISETSNIILSVLGVSGGMFVQTKNSTFQFGMSRMCASNGKYGKARVKTLLAFVPLEL